MDQSSASPWILRHDEDDEDISDTESDAMEGETDWTSIEARLNNSSGLQLPISANLHFLNQDGTVKTKNRWTKEEVCY